VVCVVRWQGPQANGMPELHKLTPPLAVLQGKGFKVALVTDGRMSGASGKVPAAIHVSPEAAAGGPLAKVQDGDRSAWTPSPAPCRRWWMPPNGSAPTAAMPDSLRAANGVGMGRELFAACAATRLTAEEGACSGCNTRAMTPGPPPLIWKI
jgi:phosphogluconate dehydratase